MADNPRFCISCGAALEAGQRFCHECGVRIDAAISDEDEQSTQPLVSPDSTASAEESPQECEHSDESEARALDGQDEDLRSDGAQDTVELEEDSSEDKHESDADTECENACESTNDTTDVPTETEKSETIQEVVSSESTDGGIDETIESELIDEDVSCIDISDGVNDTFEAMQTAQIPSVEVSVPMVEQQGPTESFPVIPDSSRTPGGTAPMPLINAQQTHGYAPNQDTQVMPPVDSSYVSRQYRQANPAGPVYGVGVSPEKNQSESRSKRNILIAVIVILAVVVVALVGALVTTSLNTQDSSANQTQTTEVENDTASTTNQDDDAIAEAEEEQEEPTLSQDRTYYNALSTYYDHLASYNDDIALAAQNFNNNYLKTSYSTRSKHAQDAADLATQIDSDYAELAQLDVPSTSEYFACYNDILTCYYDCSMRISVICDAWYLSLSYSDPTDHVDEICAPLSRDKVNGTNKYLTEFNSLYAEAKPAQPRG